MPKKPEEEARESIDAALEAAGWILQDRDQVNIMAGRGVAIREYPLKPGHGHADYLLYVDGQAVGVVEAKPAGTTLTGVERQSEKYSVGLPDGIPAPIKPLPYLYESTGVETRFTNQLDPEPRSRGLFSFHRPDTLASWLASAPASANDSWPGLRVAEPRAGYFAGKTLRGGLRSMPPLDDKDLWAVQEQAIRNLEQSLADDRPRALIQMATGSGKTRTSIASIYRLIKFGGVQRVLFLVDRSNLGRQALKEFQQYVTPDDHRKFTELYNVQRLTTNQIDPVARVVITTIQRLYSMLKGEEQLDTELEERSQWESAALVREPAPITYNPKFPVELFDLIITDECHRSIYNLWRQVLEYFDAYIVGLTATPSKQTLAFFNQNLVMEYNHEQAVADGVNVDFDVYRIRTQITEHGSTVEAGLYVDKRDRLTRAVRWEQLDEDFTYGASALDRDVVARDQIRTVIRTFRDRLFTEIYPGRSEVPKTLIYAKDDSHADDIVQIVREEFARGNQFAEKITYRAGTTRIVETRKLEDGTEVEEVVYRSGAGQSPEDLLQAFRNAYYPRIVVTVDMIATGTDIKPLEIVMFMREVKSRNFFEQMKGRGVRVISDADLQTVTPNEEREGLTVPVSKTHFVIVDAVGVTEMELQESRPLERQPTVSFDRLIQSVALGNVEPDVLSSLASRIARLDRRLEDTDRKALADAAGGVSLKSLVSGIVEALDPDRHVELARAEAGLPPDAEPDEALVRQAGARLMREAAAPIMTRPDFRNLLIDVKRRSEQTIDTISADILLEAAPSEAAREKQRELVRSFEAFLAEHRDEITALQVLYNRPYAQRLRPVQIKELAEALQRPPLSLSSERVWQAYAELDRSRVRGAPRRVLTDIVALVRFALQQDEALVPFPETVEGRYREWLAHQEASGRRFTAEQRWWLDAIKDTIAKSFAADIETLELEYASRGGAGRAWQVFGPALEPLLEELNRELVA
jgi:type I restriction enzyme R subunit